MYTLKKKKQNVNIGNPGLTGERFPAGVAGVAA